jgi:hypothetical protein
MEHICNCKKIICNKCKKEILIDEFLGDGETFFYTNINGERKHTHCCIDCQLEMSGGTDESETA